MPLMPHLSPVQCTPGEDLIRRKRNEIDALIRELERIESALVAFPDMQATRLHRDGPPLCLASSANALADRYRLDLDELELGTVVLWLYLESNGLQVHTVPPYLEVGEVYYTGKGWIPYPDWQERARLTNLSQKMIQSLQALLDKNPPNDE